MTDTCAQEPGQTGTARRGIYKYETTGSRVGDWAAAAKRIDVVHDFQNWTKQPCARSSLLAGIGAGMGILVVRLPVAGPFWAAQWAVGAFCLIGMGSRQLCMNSIAQERNRLEQVVEAMPSRFIKTEDAPPAAPPA